MTSSKKPRLTVTVVVEVPSRAEVLRHGELTHDGWQFGVSAVYRWRGRQWLVPPRRGKPKPVWFECEVPQS